MVIYPLFRIVFFFSKHDKRQVLQYISVSRYIHISRQYVAEICEKILYYGIFPKKIIFFIKVQYISQGHAIQTHIVTSSISCSELCHHHISYRKFFLLYIDLETQSIMTLKKYCQPKPLCAAFLCNSFFLVSNTTQTS